MIIVLDFTLRIHARLFIHAGTLLYSYLCFICQGINFVFMYVLVELIHSGYNGNKIRISYIERAINK